jgi:hypothetical protein
MSNNKKRTKYAFVGNSKPVDAPKLGPRHVVLGLGGTGGAITAQIRADEALMASEPLRVGNLDSDEGTLAGLEKEQAYFLGGVPVQELLQALAENPAAFSGGVLKGGFVKLWGNSPPRANHK